MKGSFSKALPKEPCLDEISTNNPSPALYRFSDVISFSSKHFTDDLSKRSSFLEPTIGSCANNIIKLGVGPYCDITGKSNRSKEITTRKVNFVPSFIFSIFIHSFSLLVVLFYSYFGLRNTLLNSSLEKPIELTFGIPDVVGNANPSATSENKTTMDELATKTEKQLPQLPKVFAVDVPESAPDTMPLPQTPEIKVATPKFVTEATPPENIKKLSPQETLKRAEKENREIAPEEKQGTHVRPDKGAKAEDELPTDPFADTKKVADIPIPSGDPTGKLSPEQMTYKEKVGRRLKNLWKLPDVYSFDPQISCEAEVIVNLYGKVVSKKIVRSSGQKVFDNYVLSFIDDASPFPEPPRDLQSPRLILKFNPGGIR